jgi:ABC-type Fe3+ transport system substrate-binding protein
MSEQQGQSLTTAGKLISFLMVLGLVALGGYIVWMRMHPSTPPTSGWVQRQEATATGRTPAVAAPQAGQVTPPPQPIADINTKSAVLDPEHELQNILDAVDPYFVLPEVKDPKQWWGGHLWADNAKRFLYVFVAYQTVSLWTNPNEYKPAEFSSFDDLLNAKLRGRIGISDPRTPGSGSSMWSYMLYIKGEEYLKRLVAQKLFVTRDLRLLAENLAKGKIAVTTGIGYSEFLPFIKANLPVLPLPMPKEGLYVSGGYGHLTVLKNPPHHNAAKVFVNWLLSRDGQEVFTRGMGVGSRRLDVDTHWLKEYGVVAAKDFLTLEQYHRYENQSEDKVYKIREPGAAMARKLLGS